MGKKTISILTAALCLLGVLAAGPLPAQEPEGGGGPPEGEGANTGNDPRDFSSKFMPYVRFTKLENEFESTDFTVFGMWAMSSKFALTYEVPIARYYDIRNTAVCAGLPDTPCFGELPFFGNPEVPVPIGAEGDGEEVGLGDAIIRLFASTKLTVLGGGFLYGLDINVPTATKDVLGAETATIGPVFINVWDVKFWPAPGSFFAMMHIFQFDIWKDSNASDVERYFGRWFLQLPINKKHKLYILTEFQPLYDFENEHFSFWVGPEFGKAFAPGAGTFRNGGAIYFKPGWGVNGDEDSGDRAWSFELGFRYFFPPAREIFKMMKGGGG